MNRELEELEKQGHLMLASKMGKEKFHEEVVKSVTDGRKLIVLVFEGKTDIALVG